MTKYNVTRHVNYSADQIYAIAADVPSYHDFIPLVRLSTVRNWKRHDDGTETFDAHLLVTYRKLGIRETFTSKVVADPANRIVTSSGGGGAVKSLVSVWKIMPSPQGGADIEYAVDFTMNSRSMQFLLSGMFDLAVRKVMGAFEERARMLYGPPPVAA
ncbi:MAG: type II toxin-antitoxin system RatA family toxin [Aestuariivirga sp.]